MRARASFLALHAAALAGACAAPPPPAPAAPVTIASAPPPTPCEARVAEARALVDRGKLEIARRALAADGACADDPVSLAALLPLLAELGRPEEVIELAHAALTSPHAGAAVKKTAADLLARAEAEAASPPPDGLALAREGAEVARRGDAVASAKLFARAIAAFDRRGEMLSMALPPGLCGADHAAFAVDGSRFAIADCAGISVRSAATLDEVLHLQGHKGDILALALSPDGSRLVSGARDHTARVWDLATGRMISVIFDRDDEIFAVAISPDGRRIATATQAKLRIWDVATGTEVKELASGPRYSAPSNLRFSPDGARLTGVALPSGLRIWDLATGRVVSPKPLPRFDVTNAAFSPDGAVVALSGFTKHANNFPSMPYQIPLEQRIEAWDVATAKLRGAVTVSRGGDLALSADDGVLAVSADGTRVAATVLGESVRIYDAASMKLVDHQDGKVSRFRALAFTGHVVVGATWDGTVHPWDPGSSKWQTISIAGEHDAVRALFASNDGKTVIAIADGSVVRAWEVGRSFQDRGAFDGRDVWFSTPVFSPDRRRMAIASGGEVRLWDLARPEAEPTELGMKGEVLGEVIFSPDGALLAVSTREHGVRLFDTETGAPRLTIATKWSPRIAFSPDGKRLATAAPRPIEIFDTTTGDRVSVVDASYLYSLTYSPDGKLLAGTSPLHNPTTSNIDTVAPLFWDAVTGAPQPPLSGPPIWVQAQELAISPDGATIAAGSEDRGVRFWDASTRAERTPPRAAPPAGKHDGATSLAFSSDGKYVVSTDHHHGSPLGIWDSATGLRVAAIPSSGLGASHPVSVPGLPLFLVKEGRGAVFRRFPDASAAGDLRLAAGGRARAFLAPSGEIEITGRADDLRDLARCRVGPWSFPYALCEQRLERAGLFSRALQVDPRP
jgi:WD40 repeat protein